MEYVKLKRMKSIIAFRSNLNPPHLPGFSADRPVGWPP